MPKCADCGYLTIREHLSRTLRTAEKEFRERLETPPDSPTNAPNSLTYDPWPVCFRRRVDFVAIAAHLTGKEKTDRICQFFQEDQPCTGFFQWKLGFSPQEHFEMDMIERQQAPAKEAAREDRKWREDQATVADTRHKENITLTTGNQRWTWTVAIALGLLAATAAAFSRCVIPDRTSPSPPVQIQVVPVPVPMVQPPAEPMPKPPPAALPDQDPSKVISADELDRLNKKFNLDPTRPAPSK